MTKVTTITCPECGYTVFSRARHDFRSCMCGKVFIDGGFDYTKIGFPPEFGELCFHHYHILQIEIPQTPMELYNDWNTRTNRYGLIPPEIEGEEE